MILCITKIASPYNKTQNNTNVTDERECLILSHYRRTCERPNKGNKAIERNVIASYQVAQRLGFRGDFRQWGSLLRIGD